MPEARAKALAYHADPEPGKISTAITKACATQNDLALAYTPGVAEPVRAIAKCADAAYDYTGKGNLVGVISDGSAVLGLGNVGALAGKPVMEGKAVLFKKFAGIDVFDLEVDARDADHFVDTVLALAPTFGGINLEDIAAPHCFEIENRLQALLDIPVFHDDQHGTAIIIAASLLNALELQNKALEDVRIVCLGAGAAAMASMNLLKVFGLTEQQLLMVDRQGVIHDEREGLTKYKRAFAVHTPCRSLQDAMRGADVFVGVSGANLVGAEDLALMADRPVVFALSNPDPEVSPVLVHSVHPKAVMGTGRSDFPNQVNNILGFPFIFRGALDVRARSINVEMKVAAVHALRALAHEPVPEVVLQAYGVTEMAYGPAYIIPKPLDPRLIDRVPPAVAKAAVDSGVARLAYPEHYPVLP